MAQEISIDSYRFVNLVVFILAAFCNSVPTQAFSGISPIITKVYEINQLQANIPSFIFPLSYIFLLLPANYIIEKKGLKIGTVICEICMIIGLSVRLLINVNYYFFCLGTFFCSLGFCFMINAAPKFANLWFGKKEIFLVNSIVLFAMFASDAIGSVLSSYCIESDATKEDILGFFMIQSFVMIGINVLMIIFFKKRPKNIQNYASAAKRNSFKEDLKGLLKNKNYKILFLATTFIFSDLTLIFVFLPWINYAYNYKQASNWIMIMSANLVGLIGCILVGVVGTKYSYRQKCMTLCFGFFFSGILFLLSYQNGQPLISYMVGGFSGLCTYPLLTTLIDFAVETSFPIGEGTSGGILIFGGQLFGVILAGIFSTIFDGQSISLTRVLLVILIIIQLLGVITLCFSQEILKRSQYQELKQRQNQSLISQKQDD